MVSSNTSTSEQQAGLGPYSANPPLVSVLIPTWNSERTIAQSIESVLSQTFQDFELIVVDDQSTDTTFSILERYKGNARVRVYRNETNLGLMPNFNMVSTEN